MNKNIFKKLLLSVLGLILPTVVKAADYLGQGLDSITMLFPGGGITGAQTLTGPGGLIANIIVLMLSLAGIVAVLYVIIGGFWYITAAGNEEQAEKGKNTLLNAVIGIVVIVLSYVIINVVSNFIAYGV